MYTITTRAPHERIDVIQKGVTASAEKYVFFEYQNRRHDLPVVRVDINLPIYRMANQRTCVHQRSYIRDHKKADDFFSAGQENESAQQAQHELLVEFAKEGKAVSLVPIIQELDTEGQRDPILVTADGVVVNGNRRLAAMRELYYEQPTAKKHFSHVNCAVLPANVGNDELIEIEVRLQMQRETKLPYGWVEESLLVRQLLESGKSANHIADLMKKSKKDVEVAVRALTEADLYLKEWLRQPKEYEYVEKMEQFFTDLAKNIDGKEGGALEVSRRIGWALLSGQDKLTGRIYSYNFSFGKKSDEVAAVLAERTGIDLAPEVEGDDADDDDIEVSFGGDDLESAFQPLIDAFDDNDQRESLIEELIAVCDSIMEQDRQGGIGRRALAAVQTANSKLQEVDLTRAEPSTYAPMKSQLESVVARVNKLLETLSKISDKSAP